MNRVGMGIPIFKDLANLKEIINEIEINPELPIDFYILDHGSKDVELSAYLDSLKISNVKILRVDENYGFGGGIKYLLQNIENDFIGWMPGNGKVNPKNLIVLSDLFSRENNIEAFKAHRSRRSPSENFKTFSAGLLISLYFQTNLFDSGGTPTIIKRDFVSHFLNGPNDFSFEAFSLFVIKTLKIKMVRLDVPYGVRMHGSSHWQRGFKSEIKLFFRIIIQKKHWRQLLKKTPLIKN
jgi:hypothetical protein